MVEVDLQVGVLASLSGSIHGDDLQVWNREGMWKLCERVEKKVATAERCEIEVLQIWNLSSETDLFVGSP